MSGQRFQNILCWGSLAYPGQDEDSKGLQQTVLVNVKGIVALLLSVSPGLPAYQVKELILPDGVEHISGAGIF